STYDHRVWKTGLPVRSAVPKPHAGRLVVGWVTTSESLLLYVFLLLFFFFFSLLLTIDRVLPQPISCNVPYLQKMPTAQLTQATTLN
ncbi:hypothetical protein BO78DRAFT_330600, partial [Aspergillus sclerotiicarbonarius CBS 121057]